MCRCCLYNRRKKTPAKKVGVFQCPYKISILEELFPLVEEGNHYICITRPRRFGKTVTANLIASFFSKGCDASDVFDRLKVSGNQEYRRKMNQYNVIHISLNEVLCDL